jgi:hypothetical protein
MYRWCTGGVRFCQSHLVRHHTRSSPCDMYGVHLGHMGTTGTCRCGCGRWTPPRIKRFMRSASTTAAARRSLLPATKRCGSACRTNPGTTLKSSPTLRATCSSTLTTETSTRSGEHSRACSTKYSTPWSSSTPTSCSTPAPTPSSHCTS